MLRFDVWNQDKAEASVGDMPYAMISITDPKDRVAKLPEDNFRIDVLRLQFNDINERQWEMVGDEMRKALVPFDIADAEEILEFVDRMVGEGIEYFIIHCGAGLSRSPGVAAALSKIYNQEDQGYFDHYHPNTLVYKTILESHQDRTFGD